MVTDTPGLVRMPPIVIEKKIEVDKDERTILAVISTEDVDRDGELVKTHGIDRTNFRKNPVVLFMHDPRAVIGKSLWEKIRKRDGRNEMIAKVKFAETDLAKEVFELVSGGFILGASVGLSGRGMDLRDPKPSERRFHGEALERVIAKAELTEFSFVSVPANQEALTTAATKGLVRLTHKLLGPIVIKLPEAVPTITTLTTPPPIVDTRKRAPIPVVRTKRTDAEIETLARQHRAFAEGRT